MAIVLTCGLGTFVLKLPGNIGKIIVSKMQSAFCTNMFISMDQRKGTDPKV